MDETITLLNLISLFIAFVFILWGLKIFKFYIILMGILTGGALGAVIGGLIGRSGDSVIVGAVVMGILFGIIAWPLHKFFVYMISGLLSGMLSAVLFTALGVPPNALIAVGIIFFIIGFIIAVKLYEYIIVIIMAYGGVSTIFYLIFWRYLRVSTRRFNISAYWERMLKVYSEFIIFLLFILILFVFFAIYFQKIKAISKSDNNIVRWEKLSFKRITYLFASFSFLSFAILTIADSRTGMYIYRIIGVSIISWPVFALATSGFVNWLNSKGESFIVINNEKTTRFIMLMIFGLIGIPLISGLFEAISVSIIGKRPDVLFKALFLHFELLFREPAAAAIFKWIFLALALPGLIYTSVFDSKLLEKSYAEEELKDGSPQGTPIPEVEEPLEKEDVSVAEDVKEKKTPKYGRGYEGGMGIPMPMQPPPSPVDYHPRPVSAEIEFYSGEFAGSKIPLKPDQNIIIGREALKCNIVLSDPQISRMHVLIFFDPIGNQFVVTDLESSHGTYIDGYKMRKGSEQYISNRTRIVLADNVAGFYVNIY